ncbi:nucleoside hydrolase [Saccharopolyspora elongata]|uniref:Nucleoside hydrolase n=1 Tax=Saccharopolyspora elongata TaxID=2530387 RepID=A0A4R4Z5H5_9PSEU|nr:nucleoside hydrolase [Saccharopolyspora elongata]TDD53146.1 nucleoside hydrolase [Saccharopolyspora elongata]
MTTRIVLDCDTGSDDAVAIMAAALHPELELIAVSTVNGNVALPNTTENTLRVLDHIGVKVPVHAGAARPLVRPDFPVPRHILNADNPDFQIDYLDLEPSTTEVRPGSAVQLLIDTFLVPENDDVVLVALGPLTNVALALIAEPRLAAKIRKLVIMGGAHVGGNVTPTAEFNFWVDPEAARAVFSAGIRDIVVVPLDATHSAPLTATDCEEFHALGTPAGTAASALIRHRIEEQLEPETAAVPVHDALCIAYLVRPDVITASGSYHVDVETSGDRTLGQMIVDTRPWSTAPVTATVATAASAEVFREVLRDAFGNGA